ERAELESEKRGLEKTLRGPTPDRLAGLARWEATVTSEPSWQPLTPTSVTAQSGAIAAVDEDATIRVPSTADTDVYSLDVLLPDETVTAIRMEAVNDSSLPNGGPGHGGGKFVLSRATATVAPP